MIWEFPGTRIPTLFLVKLRCCSPGSGAAPVNIVSSGVVKRSVFVDEKGVGGVIDDNGNPGEPWETWGWPALPFLPEGEVGIGQSWS
jgi:hypothetical protein